jgi:hypothetical protein
VAEAFDRRNIEKAINEEIEYLHSKIKARLGSLGSYLKIDYETHTLYLQYRIDSKKVTARDYHNPASKRFNITGQGQPFQDVLADEGYIEIEPAPKTPIPISRGQAPGIRLRAKMGPKAVERIRKTMVR